MTAMQPGWLRNSDGSVVKCQWRVSEIRYGKIIVSVDGFPEYEVEATRVYRMPGEAVTKSRDPGGFWCVWFGTRRLLAEVRKLPGGFELKRCYGSPSDKPWHYKTLRQAVDRVRFDLDIWNII